MADRFDAGAEEQPQRAQAWHPETAFLVVLVLAELGALVALRLAFRHAHGG